MLFLVLCAAPGCRAAPAPAPVDERSGSPRWTRLPALEEVPELVILARPGTALSSDERRPIARLALGLIEALHAYGEGPVLVVLERATNRQGTTIFAAFRGMGGERFWRAHPYRQGLLPSTDAARDDEWLWVCAMRAQHLGPFLRFERTRDEIGRRLRCDPGRDGPARPSKR